MRPNARKGAQRTQARPKRLPHTQDLKIPALFHLKFTKATQRDDRARMPPRTAPQPARRRAAGTSINRAPIIGVITGVALLGGHAIAHSRDHERGLSRVQVAPAQQVLNVLALLECTVRAEAQVTREARPPAERNLPRQRLRRTPPASRAMIDKQCIRHARPSRGRVVHRAP